MLSTHQEIPFKQRSLEGVRLQMDMTLLIRGEIRNVSKKVRAGIYNVLRKLKKISQNMKSSYFTVFDA